MKHVVIVSLSALVLLGCSSGSSKGPATNATSTSTGPTTTGSTAPTSASETTVAPASSAASVTTGSSTAASTAADDTAAITAAFTTFFDGVNPDIAGKVAVLEDGDQLRQMIVDASANPQFQQLSTTVNSVSMLSDSDCAAAGEVSPCAAVAHDMFVGGLPAMVGLTSHAVKIDGVWKVSAKSWCAIVKIGGSECPALPAG